MKLSQLLKVEGIIPDLHGLEREAALREVASNLAHQTHHDEGQLIQALLARELRSATGIQGGVALPHCRTGILDTFAVCYARSRPGIDFGAADGKPCHHLVALVSSIHEPDQHVRLLAQVAALFRDAQLRSDLMAATDREELLRLIVDAEARHSRTPTPRRHP